MVTIKTFIFSSIHSIVVTKLDTSPSQKALHWNAKMIQALTEI